ncbi:MAG: hypothetical protein P1V35_15485 [Planctomycetota bacterium]|nr:hypothetical protein [Planctomycetota bacterium]
MSRRHLPWILAAAGLMCLVVGARIGMRADRTPRSPLASLAASWQWIQFDQSLARGSWEQAYLHADRALALDSESPEGWATLSSHLVFDRGSFLNEPDDARRMAWMQAGIDVLLEGIEQSRDPGEVHLVLGQTLVLYIAHLAALEEDPLPWPGGPEAARSLGMEHLNRALELGHRRAPKVLEIVTGAHLDAVEDDHGDGDDEHDH